MLDWQPQTTESWKSTHVIYSCWLGFFLMKKKYIVVKRHSNITAKLRSPGKLRKSPYAVWVGGNTNSYYKHRIARACVFCAFFGFFMFKLMKDGRSLCDSLFRIWRQKRLLIAYIQCKIPTKTIIWTSFHFVTLNTGAIFPRWRLKYWKNIFRKLETSCPKTTSLGIYTGISLLCSSCL